VIDSPVQPVARLRLPSEAARYPSHEILLYPGQKVRLGRAADNDIVLDDQLVSREHAQIEWSGDGFMLSDLGSINGTFVNSVRLFTSPRQLRDGDEITLSTYLLVYELLRGDGPGLDLLSAQVVALLEDESRGPRLVVSAGPDLGQEFPLWGEVITIGRASHDATWEIRLTDRSVSRPHARLERGEGGCILSDLESANGTLLNGALISGPAALQPGDVISVGETSLVYFP
jgi:ABC transport system ATP-binding/permease protein